MNTDEPIKPGELRGAVSELTRAVTALEITLKRDYPTRTEVRKRRVQIAGAMVVAIIASYFFTIGTINYCFLSGIPEDNDVGFCHIFPRYEESFDNNRQAQELFRQLIETTEQNKAQIAELEQKVP